ncbi:MAG: hypothetical protein IOC66_13510 [Burkholderia sp.]|nr:hypothetical protein [Burkholderia sp.]
MRINVQIEGSMAAWSLTEVRAGERAVQRGIAQSTVSLKGLLRGQITGAQLGGRLAGSIRSEVYPKGKPSMNAAGLVFSKAPKIIDAFDKGPLIRAESGLWLAIPLPNIGKGPRGRKLTPGEWEKRTGRQLRFVYRRGRTALLVDEGKKAPGNVFVRRRTRGGTRLMEPRTFKNRIVPIFTLVPQVKLRKRLDIARAATQATQNLAAAIVSNWRS